MGGEGGGVVVVVVIVVVSVDDEMCKITKAPFPEDGLECGMV